jgi:hypothetical protein
MAIMRVMQPPVHEIVDVVPVGHGFVSAARSMCVSAPGIGRAAQGISVADLDNMFVDVVFVRVMQMTIVEVIDMAMMAQSCVSTARTMFMSVMRMMMLVAENHGLLAYLGNCLVALNMQHGRDAMVGPLRDIAKEQSGGKLLLIAGCPYFRETHPTACRRMPTVDSGRGA